MERRQREIHALAETPAVLAFAASGYIESLHMHMLDGTVMGPDDGLRDSR